MASKQAGWMIYKQQMGLLEHGDALWEPAPIYSYKRVNLGDVGYIRRGRFHLLFSAGCPLGSRQPGVDVPLTFEPLDTGPVIFSQPRLPGYLCTSTVKETGAGLSASVSAAPFLEPGASFSFELTEKQGAALVTKYRTYREDIELESAFEEYTKRHYDSWVTFARNARHGNDIKPVLVTGVDMTRDFAMIAYSNNTTRLSSEFTTSASLLASASASAWGTWNTQGLVHTNCGPQLCSTPSSPDALDLSPPDSNQVDVTPNEYNQCVFIRYYTMRKRALMFPKVIRAAAGPHDLGSGSNCDETFPELMVQSSLDSDTGSDSSRDSTTDYPSSVTSYESELELFHNVPSEEEDTFDVIAEYVFQNSEAEAVLIHHRDIAQIREGTLGTEMSELFSERRPTVVLDSIGVGRLAHRGGQQLAGILSRTIDSTHVVAARPTCPGVLSSQPSAFSIRLDGEDTWVLSRGLLLLLATYSKGVSSTYVRDRVRSEGTSYLSRVSITGIMSVGTAGVVGMFMGQSIRVSKSLLMPLTLAPSSWQLDLTLTLLQEVSEEALLVTLAEKHLDIKLTNIPSMGLLEWDEAPSPIEQIEKRRKRGVRKRHSMPPTWETEEQKIWDELEALSATIGDLDANSLKGDDRRDSARSMTSNGCASTNLYEPRSRSSVRFSNGSSSSVLTGFSGETASTSLTAPSSGAMNKRSSRTSMLQREKRFSSLRIMDGIPWESDETSQPGTPTIPTTPTPGSSSRRLKGIIPRRASSDTRSTNMLEHGVLPPPPKQRGRSYTASLTSLWRRESSDEAHSVDIAPGTDTSTLGRRARFKQFVKGIFKV